MIGKSRADFEEVILERQRLKLDLAKQSLDAGKAHIMKCDVRKEIIEVSTLGIRSLCNMAD